MDDHYTREVLATLRSIYADLAPGAPVRLVPLAYIHADTDEVSKELPADSDPNWVPLYGVHYDGPVSKPGPFTLGGILV